MVFIASFVIKRIGLIVVNLTWKSNVMASTGHVVGVNEKVRPQYHNPGKPTNSMYYVLLDV